MKTYIHFFEDLAKGILIVIVNDRLKWVVINIATTTNLMYLKCLYSIL